MLEGTPSRSTERIECEGKGEGELEWVNEEGEEEDCLQPWDWLQMQGQSLIQLIFFLEISLENVTSQNSGNPMSKWSELVKSQWI